MSENQGGGVGGGLNSLTSAHQVSLKRTSINNRQKESGEAGQPTSALGLARNSLEDNKMFQTISRGGAGVGASSNQANQHRNYPVHPEYQGTAGAVGGGGSMRNQNNQQHITLSPGILYNQHYLGNEYQHHIVGGQEGGGPSGHSINSDLFQFKSSTTSREQPSQLSVTQPGGGVGGGGISIILGENYKTMTEGGSTSGGASDMKKINIFHHPSTGTPGTGSSFNPQSEAKHASYFSNPSNNTNSFLNLNGQPNGAAIFKLPQIKAAATTKEEQLQPFKSPQRLSHLVEGTNMGLAEYLSQETDRKIIETAGTNVSSGSGIFNKKFINVNIGAGNPAMGGANDDIIFRNARFYRDSANNNNNNNVTPNINFLLLGGPNFNTQGGLAIQGQRHQHQEMMSEHTPLAAPSTTTMSNKKKSSTDKALALGSTKASEIPIVKRQYNHYYSNIKNKVQQQQLLDHTTQGANVGEILMSTKINTPSQHNEIPYAQQILQAQAIQLQQASKEKLKTMGKVGGGSLNRNNPNQQSTNFEFLDRLGASAEESKNVEQTPSRLAKVNMNYNPYQEGQQQQKQQQQEFLSPKLLYKKRKREYYQSQSKGHQVLISPLIPLTINNKNGPTTNPSTQQREGPQNTGKLNASAALNNVIHQLLLKNGNQTFSFSQALRNLTNSNSKVGDNSPLTPQDALDLLNRLINDGTSTGGTVHRNSSLPSLGRSVSQEVIPDDHSLTSHGQQPLQLLITDYQTAQGGGSPPALGTQSKHYPLEQQQQQQQLNLKNLQHKGRMLNATELYELAKQIKYKQYYQLHGKKQQGLLHQTAVTGGQQLPPSQQQSSGTAVPGTERRTAAPGVQGKGGRNQVEKQLQEVFNVVKLNQKRISEVNGGNDTTSNPSDARLQNEMQLKQIQMQFQKQGGGDHTSTFEIPQQLRNLATKDQQQLAFVFRYMNKNNEVITFQDDPVFQLQPNQQQNQDELRDSSRNAIQHMTFQQKQKKMQSVDRHQDGVDQLYLVQGTSAGTSGQHVRTKTVVQQSIDAVNQNLSKSSAAKNSFINSGMLISQVHMIYEEQRKMQEQQLQEALLQVVQLEPVHEQVQPQPAVDPAVIFKDYKIKVSKKIQQQQQLSKITKISELEKLLYQIPGYEEGPVINLNPGGGGRVTNRVQPGTQAVLGGGVGGGTVPLKKRLEPQISDNDNAELAEHAINKAIKMMNIMNAVFFKGLKDFGPVQVELMYRCGRFFGFQIPKHFKQDLPTLLKQKDFLSSIKEKMYATFNLAINKTNGITEQMIQVNQSQGQYKYSIGGGNNHMLVKTVFKQRSSWWIQSDKETFEECNFVWTQWLKERHIKSLPPFDKANPIGSLPAANCQDPQEMETSSPQLPFIRMYNKMQNNQNLSDKKHLFFNMRELYQNENRDIFTVMPLTYVINDGLNDLEWDRFEVNFKATEEEMKNQSQQQQQQQQQDSAQQTSTQPPNSGQEEEVKEQKTIQNVWIIKPGEDTNRGCGIIVTKDFNEIKQIVRDKSSRSNKSAILQKYIENPLLINKRKFDIRCYGVMTSINGHLLGFFYQDGYLRTSCKEFSVQNLNNRYIHLTNDAVQKNSEDYGKFENANKLSYSDFDRYFAEFPHQDYELRFTRDFLPQIRALVRDTFRCVEKKIDQQRRTNSFEIFGYDFMIDDDLKLKLIEVNTNPSLEICCPLLARIIPSLLDSAFKIAMDPLFQQPPNRKMWNGSEAINDLKMELVFESPFPNTPSQ